MRVLMRLGLALAPVASSIQLFDSKSYSDEISAISADTDEASRGGVVMDEISAEQSTEAAVQGVMLDEVGAEQMQNAAGLEAATAAAPKEGGLALLESGSFGHSGSSGHSLDSMTMESNRHLFSAINEGERTKEHETIRKAILEKVAKGIKHDQRNAFSHLTAEERLKLANMVANQEDLSFVDVLAPPSPMSKPVLVPPRAEFSMPRENTNTASFIESDSHGSESSSGYSGFQPSADFQSDAGELTEAAADQGLPWGVGSPRTGDSLPVFHYSSMPAIDVPKEWEYSLNSGDNIQSFSTAQQDVKLLTQIFRNITQGFFLDTNAGNGEEPSNTLLLELLGWRGLIMEPRGYKYLELWGKMRKAWLFLGCISPHENATRIGFDTEGNIDMLSGHMIHAYNMKDFMAEMGGRKTIDFWNLHSGGYEAEILNETLLGVGSFLEFGVILVRFDGRRTGRGYESFVQPRSKDETEEIIFEILHNASFKYIGGLDAYWINHVSPRFDFKDKVFVNPSYFTARNLPVPTTIKSAPPPPLSYPGDVPGHQFYTGARKSASAEFPALADWDSGFDASEVSKIVVAFVKASRAAAANQEPPAKAVRAPSTKLVDYYDSVGTDA